MLEAITIKGLVAAMEACLEYGKAEAAAEGKASTGRRAGKAR